MSVSIAVRGGATGTRLPSETHITGTVHDVLTALGLSPQEFLVVIGDSVVSVDTPVKDGDSLTLIRAITGG